MMSTTTNSNAASYRVITTLFQSTNRALFVSASTGLTIQGYCISQSWDQKVRLTQTASVVLLSSKKGMIGITAFLNFVS